MGALLAPIPQNERHEMMLAYHRRLTHADKAVRIEAARAWSIWEGETITLLPEPATSGKFGEAGLLIAFARIENHFLRQCRLAGRGTAASRCL